MANQMIALQARNPQLPDPARQTAQFANFMNMAKQQEAAQRQSALAQQTMDINRAQEARAAALQEPALTKAQQDNIVQALGIFREAVGDIAEGDVAAAEAVRADLVSRVPGFDKFIPPATTWDRNTRNRLMMTAEKEIDKTIATPVASLEVSTSGQPRSVTVGGLRPGQQGVYDIPETPTVAPRATPTAPAAAGTDVNMRATQGSNTTPQDLIDQGMDPRNIPSGMPTSPASFTRGAGAVQMTPEVAQQIVDTAVKTGMMAQADFDQLMALAPEQNKQPFMDMLKANNIALQPGGAGQQSQFADLRGQRMQSQTAGLRGAPPMEQTLAQMRTSTPLQQRNPNVSPLPGSSQVPLSRVAGEKTTEAQATADVNLRMAPKIATATKEAERAVEKKSEALVAKNESKTLVQSLDNYINDIDELLRSPDRRFIVGRIEGNLHYLGSLGQNERQAELQAMYDRVKNTDTLTSLVEMKQASPSGGSPVGNASNQDVQLVAKGANALTQTGGVPKFDEELKKLRRQAYRARQNAIEFYKDRYGELATSDPKFKLNVRPIADRYISSKDLPKTRTPVQRKASGGFTVVRVED